jgi:hypothetical protein
MSAVIAWIPPQEFAERVLRSEPFGGRPSIARRQRSSERGWEVDTGTGCDAMWHYALVLSVDNEPCRLSLMRASELLADREGWEGSFTGATWESAPNAPEGSYRLIRGCDVLEAYGHGENKLCPWWHTVDGLGGEPMWALARVLVVRLGGKVLEFMT